eukprot:1196154-Prorocentrum_minimum.AAC.4
MSRSCVPGYGRGYGVDARGYGVDARGYGVDVRGYRVNIRGYGAMVWMLGAMVWMLGATMWTLGAPLTGGGVVVEHFVLDRVLAIAILPPEAGHREVRLRSITHEREQRARAGGGRAVRQKLHVRAPHLADS